MCRCSLFALCALDFLAHQALHFQTEEFAELTEKLDSRKLLALSPSFLQRRHLELEEKLPELLDSLKSTRESNLVTFFYFILEYYCVHGIFYLFRVIIFFITNSIMPDSTFVSSNIPLDDIPIWFTHECAVTL